MDMLTSIHSEARVTAAPLPLNQAAHQNGAVSSGSPSGTERITVSLPKALVERLRNAVYWTETRTMARIIADALDEAVSDMERANGGGFSLRLRPLRPGRRRVPSVFAQPTAPTSTLRVLSRAR